VLKYSSYALHPQDLKHGAGATETALKVTNANRADNKAKGSFSACV
jgi:hypothetical protein